MEGRAVLAFYDSLRIYEVKKMEEKEVNKMVDTRTVRSKSELEVVYVVTATTWVTSLVPVLILNTGTGSASTYAKLKCELPAQSKRIN